MSKLFFKPWHAFKICNFISDFLSKAFCLWHRCAIYKIIMNPYIEIIAAFRIFFSNNNKGQQSSGENSMWVEQGYSFCPAENCIQWIKVIFCTSTFLMRDIKCACRPICRHKMFCKGFDCSTMYITILGTEGGGGVKNKISTINWMF